MFTNLDDASSRAGRRLVPEVRPEFDPINPDNNPLHNNLKKREEEAAFPRACGWRSAL